MADPTPPQGNDEWRIIACKSCDREIKLPTDLDEKDMACPYCSAPVTGTAAPAAALSGERKRRLSKAGSTDEKAPSWDTKPGDEGGDEDINEYVEVDPNNPDGVRVRRVRRKRTLTPAEKVTRTLGTAFIGLAALGCLAILIIFLVKGTDTASRDIEVASELPDRIQKLIEAARPEDTISPVLTEAETKAAEAIIAGYLEANGWGNKLAYVYKPDRAAPRMESWYARPQHSDAAQNVDSILRRDKIFDGGNAVIRIAIGTSPSNFKLYALRQTLEDIKLDWEVSSGYQEMTLNEFKDRRPTVELPFRVTVQASDYYNFDFTNSRQYQSLELTYAGQPDFKIFAYADRENPLIEELLRKVATQKFSAMVKLRYPEGSQNPNQALLTEMLSMSWFD